ncbi:MFS transporter [Ilumatobacter sp.]|uniref:MFS transporter n=1 Tax=Ilumatobacter sp. TaxID=1967498 RepID=UPI003B52C267
MRWRRPEGLTDVDPGAGIELARLNGLEGLARSMMVGVVPLSALEALGSKQAVSAVFFGGALITLALTLSSGWLEARLQRRWLVTSAMAAVFVAAALFTVADGPLFAVAEGLRSAEASLFSVCVSLYIMDHIGSGELTGTEPLRLMYSGAAWLIGPSVGVTLYGRGHANAPFVISMCLSAMAVAYFWRLRLHRNPVLLTPTTTVTNPARNVVRFFSQPQLRTAYAITTTRAVFWAALFIYGPIYVVEAGLATWLAGSFLSVASAMLFTSPLVGRAARRFGTRQVILVALAWMSASMVALASIGEPRPVGVVFWLTGAAGGAALDVVGNIPFMRTVHHHERIAMTSVFSTWREASFVVTPVLAGGALVLGSFWTLYLAIAVVLALGLVATTSLPARI